jgi:hypothetical protein
MMMESAKIERKTVRERGKKVKRPGKTLEDDKPERRGGERERKR